MTEFAKGNALCEGRYKLAAVIGSGGMATVWKAKDNRLGRDVAVKVISDALAADEQYVARFEREARIAAGLTHAHLVEIFDLGSEAGRPFLVMEYVDGPTLSRACARRGGCPVPSERLARDLLRALGHIHDSGIVHRDVKPQNVLLGKDGRVRLTDFGIAQLADSTRLTQTGDVIGTIRYLAPELLRGERATAASDLYALGVLLREAAADGPPPPVADLVESLTAEDPARRPRSAADALRLLLEAPPTAPVATAPVVRIERPGGRVLAIPFEPRTAILGALAALVVVVGAIQLFSGGDGSGDEANGSAPTSGGLFRGATERRTPAQEGPDASLPGKDAPAKAQLKRLNRLLEQALAD